MRGSHHQRDVPGLEALPRRVVIASRYPLVLYGLTAIVRAETDLNIVATCRGAETCMEIIRDLAPDLAVIDIFGDAKNSLKLLAMLKLGHMRTRVVLLSASPDGSELEEKIESGTHGVIPRDATPEQLVRMLRQYTSGPRALPPPKSLELNGHARQRSSEVSPALLTGRQRQIMHSVCEGRSNKDIGRQLGLSEGTVKVHLHHIYEKLAIHNRTALAVLAAPLTNHHHAPESKQAPERS